MVTLSAITSGAYRLAGGEGDLIVFVIVALIWAVRSIGKLASKKESDQAVADRLRLERDLEKDFPPQSRTPTPGVPRQFSFPQKLGQQPTSPASAPRIRPLPPPLPRPTNAPPAFRLPQARQVPPRRLQRSITRAPQRPPTSAAAQIAAAIAARARATAPPPVPRPSQLDQPVEELVAAPLPSGQMIAPDKARLAAIADAAGQSRAASRTSVSAQALHRWFQPRTLNSQFILTEILQPPLALRPPH